MSTTFVRQRTKGLDTLHLDLATARTLLAVPLLREEDFHRHDSHSPISMSGRFQTARSRFLKFGDPAPSSPSRTSASSKNLRNRWSSRPPRVKSWVSSPARRRRYSRCWMWLLKMLPESVTLSMLKSGASKVTWPGKWRTTGSSHRCSASARHGRFDVVR